MKIHEVSNIFPSYPHILGLTSRRPSHAWSPVGVLANGQIFTAMTSEVHHAATGVQDLKRLIKATARATWNGMNYWVNYTWFLIFFLLNTDDFCDLRAILTSRIIYMLWGLEWIWSQWAKCEAQKIERSKMDYSNTGLQQFRLKHSNIWIIDMGIAAVGCFVRCSSAKNYRVLMLGCTTTVGNSRGRIVF